MITEPVVRLVLRCDRCNRAFADEDYDDQAAVLWSKEAIEKTFPTSMSWRDDVNGWLRIGDRILCGGCWDRGSNNTAVEDPPLPAVDAAKVNREQAGYPSYASVDGMAGEIQRIHDELFHERTRNVTSVVFTSREEDCPRPFALYRHHDHSGVSGTGTVAHGTQFADGTTVIHWIGDNASTTVWSSLDKAMAVHGHNGDTRVVWLSENITDLADIEAALQRLVDAAEATLTEADQDDRYSQGLKKLRFAVLNVPQAALRPADDTTQEDAP